MGSMNIYNGTNKASITYSGTSDVSVDATNLSGLTGNVQTQLGTKANTADLKEIGVGQTWQDVKASRSAGATYTNNTGKPIVVSVGTYLITGTIVGIVGYVDGVMVGESRNDDYDAVSRTANVVLIVPNGSTYNFSNIGGSLYYWAELR